MFCVRAHTCVWTLYIITHPPQVPDKYELEEPFFVRSMYAGRFDVSSLRLGARFVPRVSCVGPS
jgi:hypothetical protein